MDAKPATKGSANKALAQAGHAERITQGSGYIYFIEGDSCAWYSSSIAVCKISHTTDARIVAQCEEFKRDNQ